jgi:chemotaxis protein CheX
MLGVAAERGTPYLRHNEKCGEGLVGVIGLTGGMIGTAAMCVTANMALNICERLVGIRPKAVDADVIDCVGEMINMIAGNAKAQLEQYQLSISLPTIIVGNDTIVEFPHKITPVCIPFDSTLGSMTVQIGFAPKN